MARIQIPRRTVDAVRRQFGDEGDRWLAQFPSTLGQLVQRWELDVDEPFEQGLPINVVYPVRHGLRQLVLKTGFPHPETLTELAMLRLWQGCVGCVQLIDSDEATGTVLLERVLPGTSFRSSPIERRSSDIPPLFDLKPLRMSLDKIFPDYTDWCRRAFSQYQSGRPDKYFLKHIEKANACLDEVMAEFDHDWLLHGDLHHENMLLASDGRYVAIDPKGVLGAQLMEYGRFIHNFVSDEVDKQQSISKILELRVSSLSGDYTEKQLLSAGYIDLVLSCSWTLNEGGTLSSEADELLGVLGDMY